MFVLDFKVKAGKKAKIILAASSLAVAVVCIVCMVSINSHKMPNTATCDEIGTFSLNAETDEKQCEFLNKFGFTAEKNSACVKNVTIPEKFNKTYENYNMLMKKCGLDLSAYSGRQVKMVTYRLKNAKAEYAVLLIYKNRVIGAHLTNGEYGQNNLPLV